jgi:hypothetical protein
LLCIQLSILVNKLIPPFAQCFFVFMLRYTFYLNMYWYTDEVDNSYRFTMIYVYQSVQLMLICPCYCNDDNVIYSFGMVLQWNCVYE